MIDLLSERKKYKDEEVRYYLKKIFMPKLAWKNSNSKDNKESLRFVVICQQDLGNAYLKWVQKILKHKAVTLFVLNVFSYMFTTF